MNEFKPKTPQEIADDEIIQAFLDLARQPHSTVPKRLADKLSMEHRTNQQCVIRTMILTIAEFGEQNTKRDLGTDLRNEGSVKFAKEIGSLVNDGNHYMPYV